MRLGNADLAIGALAAFPAIHHGDHACEVALQSQNLQVEHDFQIILEKNRNAGGLLDHAGVFDVRFLSAGHLFFDFADGVEVLIDLPPAGVAYLAMDALCVLANQVQDAAAGRGTARAHIRRKVGVT
jgi:hypothetical protein